MPTLDEHEQKAIDECILAESVYNAASDRLEAAFRIRVEPLCKQGDFNAAIEYLKEMPEGIAKMYLADYIRTTRGDYLK